MRGLWARVNAKAKPVTGVQVTPGTQWLKPGLVGRVRHLKGEQLLRHATLKLASDARPWAR